MSYFAGCFLTTVLLTLNRNFPAGGMRPSHKRMPTKLCVMVEAGTDHPGVPANFNPVELLTMLLHFVVA